MLLAFALATAATPPRGALLSSAAWGARLYFTLRGGSKVWIHGDRASEEVLDAAQLLDSDPQLVAPRVHLSAVQEGPLLISVSAANIAPRLFRLWPDSNATESFRCSGRNHPYCGGWAGTGAVVLQGPQAPPLARLQGHGRLWALTRKGKVLPIPSGGGGEDFRGLMGSQSGAGARLAELEERAAGGTVVRMKCDDSVSLLRRTLYVALSPTPDSRVEQCALSSDFAAPVPAQRCARDGSIGVALGVEVQLAGGALNRTSPSCANGQAELRLDAGSFKTDPVWDWYAELDGRTYFRGGDARTGSELYSIPTSPDEVLAEAARSSVADAEPQECLELSSSDLRRAEPPMAHVPREGELRVEAEVRFSAEGDEGAGAVGGTSPLLSQVQQRQGSAEGGWELRLGHQNRAEFRWGDASADCRFVPLRGHNFGGGIAGRASVRALSECWAECCALSPPCGGVHWQASTGQCEFLRVDALRHPPVPQVGLSGDAVQSFYRTAMLPPHRWDFDGVGTRESLLGLHLTAAGEPRPGREGLGWELGPGEVLWADTEDAVPDAVSVPRGAAPWSARLWARLVRDDGTERCLVSFGGGTRPGGLVSVCVKSEGGEIRLGEVDRWKLGPRFPGERRPERPFFSAGEMVGQWRWVELGFDGEAFHFNFDCVSFESRGVPVDLPPAGEEYRVVLGGEMRVPGNFSVSSAGGILLLDSVELSLGYTRYCGGSTALPIPPQAIQMWSLDGDFSGWTPPGFMPVNLSASGGVGWGRGVSGSGSMHLYEGGKV
eukprot:Hpha_TRINITY_DN11809_c0_g2::TRINITY_DN11809_c0_g2_i1::g.2084::m.2084